MRWVHTTELADVAALLRGGDLVLSTGIALSDGADELAAFAESLDRCDAAGLVIELGRRWSDAARRRWCRPATASACRWSRSAARCASPRSVRPSAS